MWIDRDDHSVLCDNPCRKDCPNRTSECHGKCEAYADFVKIRERARRENQAQTGYIKPMLKKYWKF